MFMAALSVTAPNWKQLKRSSTIEWKNKLQYIHTMKYYSIMKSNKPLIHAMASINLKIIILR